MVMILIIYVAILVGDIKITFFLSSETSVSFDCNQSTINLLVYVLSFL